MTERDTDIEFDFFDEPETEADVTGRSPRRGPRRPARPPSGVTPLLRLVGLIAGAIAIVVVLVLAVKSCSESGKKRSYERYMGKVQTIAQGSEGIGRDLNTLLTTPGIKQAELVPKLDGLAQQQQLLVAQAEKLDPPGPLRLEQQHAVEALQFRVSGLRGLADAFRQTTGSKDLGSAGTLLAAQAQRLVASDVVWDDLFKDPSVGELKNQGIGGVAVPESNFVQNPDLASARSMVAVLQRIRGAATGGTPGGLHGTGLVSVKALPGGQQLSPSSENTVTATTDLGFEVAVEDTGDSQEVQVKVTLTIQQTPSPIVKTQTIDLINPGERKTIVFRSLGQVQFATKTAVKVDVQPVPGEKNASNNSAEYPVIFSLPQ